MQPGILMRGDEEEMHNFAVERTRFARRSPRRVCQAWHRTREVQVLVPGDRGAEG